MHQPHRLPMPLTPDERAREREQLRERERAIRARIHLERCMRALETSLPLDPPD